MKYRAVLAAISLAGVAALAGCGSPTSGVSFNPPKVWKPGISMFGMMQMWTRSDRPNSVLMLMRVPMRGGTAQLDQTLKTQFDVQKSVTDKTIKICGNQPAQMSTFVGSSKKKSGQEERMQMVRTAVGDSVYMAMYAHGLNEPNDPASEAAIKSLCPKKT